MGNNTAKQIRAQGESEVGKVSLVALTGDRSPVETMHTTSHRNKKSDLGLRESRNDLGMSNNELGTKAAKWKKALTDVHTGPLIVADEICDLADSWETYRKAAGGKHCTTWLKSELRLNLGFFRIRREAVRILGEDVRRWMDHEVAVWLKTLSADDLKLVVPRLCVATKKGGDNPLPLSVVRPLVYEIIKRKPQKKCCRRCMFLESLLEQHGIAITD